MGEPVPRSGAIRSIVRRYYAVSAAYTFGPFLIFAVYPLFLRSRGLDQFHINVVSAVFVMTTFLTDVPTGAFADAVGRRAAVVVGCALHAGAFLIYFLSHRYWLFILAGALDGLGTTFGNGPIDAWAIDALDHAGFEGAKDALFSRKFQVAQIVGLAATLAGAYIAQLNIAAPFIVNTIAWLATGIVALTMMSQSIGQRKSLEQIAIEIRRRSIDSTRLGFADRTVRLLSIAGLLSAFLWYGWGQEWQQFFHQGLRTGLGTVGWVSVAIIFAQVAGLEVAARMPGAWRHRAVFIAATTTASKAAIIASGMSGRHMGVALAEIMAATFLEGVAGPMGFAWYNETIAGENRATLLSFGTTMSTVGGTIGLPVQGKLVDAFGAGVAWQIAGFVSMTNALCFLALIPRTHASKSVESA